MTASIRVSKSLRDLSRRFRKKKVSISSGTAPTVPGDDNDIEELAFHPKQTALFVVQEGKTILLQPRQDDMSQWGCGPGPLVVLI